MLIGVQCNTRVSVDYTGGQHMASKGFIRSSEIRILLLKGRYVVGGVSPSATQRCCCVSCLQTIQSPNVTFFVDDEFTILKVDEELVVVVA